MSKIKVNTIAPRSGTTVTLGEAGDTIALGACASQTGFGRTGTVDWCTTVKTSPLTAVSGKGYFINTTGGAVTVTLPSSPTAGDIVSLKDYAGTWATACKSVTLGRGGSKINGNCIDAKLTTTGQSVTMIYVDGTKGWQDIQDSTADVKGISYMSGSGGNSCGTSGNYKWHKFTADGTFTVSSVGSGSPESNQVSYLVIASGGGGAGNPGSSDASSGGGAGGFREGKNSSDPYTASPLDSTTALTVTATGYPIVVGAGGAAGPASLYGSPGNVSTFSSISSAGGGGGQYPAPPYAPATARNGGSGAGASASGNPSANQIGLGNQPPVSPSQGNNGGDYVASSCSAAGGGGGAAAVGSDAPSKAIAGDGGAGATSSIDGTPTQRGGGGAGSAYPAKTGGSGGAGGGGDGGLSPGNPSPAGLAGTTNTGGGGGAANANPGNPNPGGAGGSGVVIVRYRYQ